MAEGLDGPQPHPRSFPPGTRDAMARVAAALGLVATGGTDYHGDLGSYAESHAGLVMPDELVAGVRAALAAPGPPPGPCPPLAPQPLPSRASCRLDPCPFSTSRRRRWRPRVRGCRS